ncbi:Atrial natriuretic peptide-converting enzyme [Habropoda laboriosa]|uniref:Atrial natriuretic peptide-converting enzyme n=1 Tax=Habropoda laboriosa TaxID=597456 RepID=A0A0L7RGE6_9HYME|nr:Atrial natriuretic peptide-converting enzyme [Habropoda laboriosa]
MSTADGMDNPAFASEEECTTEAKLDDGQQQVTLDQDHKSEGGPVENGHQRSQFVSQQYVEAGRTSPDAPYRNETRIDLPENNDKTVVEPKMNGVHGNGNNNDASFLNNSATSVQINDTGKKEQIEAVNLELVSMRPYAGNNLQTKGQEACEVPADPYEEYFVPVNEHRKYISRGPEAEVETTVAGVRFDLGPGVGREGLSLRDPAAGLVDYSHWLTALRGEKLYVTKDKRSRSSYWRRMACWGCGLLVLLVAVIIAILAATGVILTQEASEPLENLQQTNSRQFGDVRTAGSQEYVKDPPSSPPPATSSFPPWPTTDETIYDTVPSALEGLLKLDDFRWNDDLSDPKSRVYRQVSSEIEERLKNMMQQPADNDTVVKVYDISRNGEVRFRISYPPQSMPEETQQIIEQTLQLSSNMIGQYHLNSLKVNKLVDQCRTGGFGCSEWCEYNYSKGLFVCSCKTGKVLDNDGKTCIDENDLSNVEMDDEIPESNTEAVHDYVQGRSRGPGTVFEPRRPDNWDHLDFTTEKTSAGYGSSQNENEHEFHMHDSSAEPVATTEQNRVFKEESDPVHWAHDHSMHDDSMHDDSMHDHSMHDHSMHDHSMHDHPMDDHSMHDQSMHDHAMHDHSMHDHSMHDHSMHNHSMHNHSMHDHSMHDQSMHDHSMHDHSMHDHSAHEHLEQNTYTTITPTMYTKIPDAVVESTSHIDVSFLNLPPNVVFSKCTAGQFQCVNGTSRDGAYCVQLSAKCDSENDCSDGSDELNCEEEGCPGNFQCASGQCLKRDLVCNKIVDCNDGSDEKNCEHWKCQFDEFRCPSGRCIPSIWQCDGRPDCEDHRDEYNCAESCGNDKYLCPTEKWCIPLTWHCNGISECANGEDEKLCDCALDQFKCQTGGCVPENQVCDGIEHCPDHSDEWGCLMTNMTMERNLTEGQKEDEGNGNQEFGDRSSLLKIRQYNGEYRLVCSDGWSEELSNSYCQALGFSGSESTELKAWDKNQKILRLKSNPNHRMPLVTNLEQMEFCVSDKVVQVSCQEFSCGSHYGEGPTARLVGGTPASEGQWSGVALLKKPKHGAACTASVLGPMHVLASYSCIHRHKQSSGWQLFTGENLLKAHPVRNIIPYPQVKYNQFLYNNDIALVELEKPLTFSRNVSAVCLPKHPIQPRQICVMVGWGFSVNGEVDLQKYLNFLPLPTLETEKCNATSHYAGFITKDNICAGFTDTDKGPCYNDEGAPLMCVSESGGGSAKWEIQGLLSHHSRCSRGHPAIYSSVEPALSWLRHSVPALQTQS